MQTRLSNNMKKFGFTLAEVLITLGVIGIVAAMTIPTIMRDIQDFQLKSAWKKSYSEISNAVKLLYINNGGNLDYGTLAQADLSNFFYDMASNMAYLSISNSPALWHSAGTWQDPVGDKCEGVNGSMASMILKNGSMIYNGGSSNGNDVDLLVDVNGKQPPNMVGRDIFALLVKTKKGMVKPFGSETSQSILSWSNTNSCASWYGGTAVTDCKTASKGWTCSTTYLYN